MILRWIPFIKNTLILTFDFLPTGTGGVPLRPSGCVESKSCIKQNVILEGVPLMKNVENPKFWLTLASPSFRLRFLWPWPKIKILLLHFFCLVLPFTKRYETTPYPKTLGGDRFGRKPTFRGPGLTLRASGSKSPTEEFFASKELNGT